MTGGITVHTIFWAPSGFSFQGSPGAGIPTYKGMVQELFTDVAHDSTGTSGAACTAGACDAFTVLPQFAQGSTDGTPSQSGAYSISYNSGTDSINDTHAYPATGQCASPNNATGACLTDAQVQAEVDRVIQSTGGSRGLHNLWYVFLPPNVDECILPGVCGTNAFGGYHSVSDVGHGTTVYAVTIDPIIEAGAIAQGADPQGNPDAEVTTDIASHETVEAMTDPTGVGYLDPNGFEVADKCEFGPQRGTPLGFAGPDNSPYNQVINGHKFLIQEMWSNDDNGCVQATSKTSNPLPLPQVFLKQFSPSVSGNIGHATSGVGVRVSVLRMGANGNPVQVASGTGTTSASGHWSLSLQHPVGDDRDEIDVDYSGAGAPSPNQQVILTGNGGNPFTESGWTGWTAMDNGTAVTNSGGPQVQIAPCFQTGVLQATINGSMITPPHGDEGLVDFCSTQTDVASIPLSSPVTAAKALTVSSNDNRAFQDPNLTAVPNVVGGLVKLTVPVGEPDSVSTFQSPLIFTPGGFPTCSADLEGRSVSCSGLVPSHSYTVTDGGSHRAAAADDTGAISVSLTVHRGDTVSLSNGSRTLTTLHVANLRANIMGEQTVLSGGSCQPDNYYAAPLSTAQTSGSAGAPSDLVGGPALTDVICSSSGHAAGLPSSPIIQTDERSGGSTQTEVPDIENTSPLDAETLYGTFTALAQSGLPGPNNSVTPTDSTSKIALTIRKASGGDVVFHAKNVDTANGVNVKGLRPGTYNATWVMSDANGDTRTVTTRFIEQRGLNTSKSLKAKVTCKLVAHHKIKCSITFKSNTTKGKLRVALARGGKVAALGHGSVSHGKAQLRLRETRRVTRGRWSMTLVLTRAHKAAATVKLALRVK